MSRSKGKSEAQKKTTAVDYGKEYAMASRSFKVTSGPQMPAEICQLVMPSPLHLNERPSDRYIPRFDPRSNRCWWEWVPPPSERGGHYWKTVSYQKRGNRSRGGGRRKRGQELCLFLDSDDESEESGMGHVERVVVLEDDLHDIAGKAWYMFHAENERREQLRNRWLEKRDLQLLR